VDRRVGFALRVLNEICGLTIDEFSRCVRDARRGRVQSNNT
jgi:hypothetical protein